MTEYRVLEMDREFQPAPLAVAWTDSLKEIMHYAMMYQQDGPIQIQFKCTETESWKELAQRFVPLKKPATIIGAGFTDS